MTALSFDVVVPTTGRASLQTLLQSLAVGGPRPGKVLLVDDRPERDVPLLAGVRNADIPPETQVIEGAAAGPAAARNTGWRASEADWIAFLDDDVVPARNWLRALADDLEGLKPDVAGSQGRIAVPLPRDRRPTDWERNVRGLEHARWATADLAYRRSVLAAVGGFDERFTHAYREDADLGLRVTRAGQEIVRGRRTVEHPVRPVGAWTSVVLQRGNADDALMRRLHGPGWHEAAGATQGRRPRHLAITVAGIVAAAGAAAGRRPLTWLGLAAWLAGTAELARARLRPGPGTRDEVARMLATSVAIPPAATWFWLSGWARASGLLREVERAPAPQPDAVLFDRDGTIVVDVPHNGDPRAVELMPGAREALDRLRSAGVPVAVVSNQSGVGRGLIRREDVEAVNRRIEELVGPLAGWFVCEHGPGDACGCRKPAPGLVLMAADALGTTPDRCVVIGDIGADVEAARAAGAPSVLVPNRATRAEEIASAPVVASNLTEAVGLVLGRSAP